jgi:hypothetical protein
MRFDSRGLKYRSFTKPVIARRPFGFAAKPATRSSHS